MSLTVARVPRTDDTPDDGLPVAAPRPTASTAAGRVTTVRVASERFGDFDVEDDRILQFDDGLPGFDGRRRFALIPVPDSADSFYWLQDVDDPSLAFLAAVPWPYFPEYQPELPTGDQDQLGIDEAADALVLCLLTIHREQQKVTANLLGPLVVNQRTRAGRQVILAEQGFPTQAPLGTPSA